VCIPVTVQGAAYGGTYDLVHKEFKELGISASMIDVSQPCHTWEHLVTPNTKVRAGSHLHGLSHVTAPWMA
jgi:O-acetylhomoserine/O-acetylserine sulfhydrylase-like pyridoxal-dependent enzyme